MNTMDAPFLLRSNLRGPRLFGILAAGTVATAALQYLWLHADTPLAFRLVGFALFPVYLLPLPLLFFMYRADLASLRRLRAVPGRPAAWFVAAVLLVAIFGGVAALHHLSGGQFDPAWKWTTLALSGALDLPLVTVQLLPMMLVQDLFFRQSVEQGLAPRSSVVSMLVSLLFWTLANAVLIVHILQTHDGVFGITLALVFPATAAFVYAAQRGSAFLLSACVLTFIATATCLLFGCDIPELNHMFFGLDVETMDGLFPDSMKGREGYAGAIAALLFLASFIMPAARKTLRR